MAEMGRPTEYTEERKAEIIKLIDEYVESTEIPILAEFCSINNIRKQRMYEHFPDHMKKITEKKEGALERKALDGDVNTTMAVFSLKQLGWSDKAENVIKTIDDDGKETGFKFVDNPEKR